jgi:hypothetical protein
MCHNQRLNCKARNLSQQRLPAGMAYGRRDLNRYSNRSYLHNDNGDFAFFLLMVRSGNAPYTIYFNLQSEILNLKFV